MLKSIHISAKKAFCQTNFSGKNFSSRKTFKNVVVDQVQADSKQNSKQKLSILNQINQDPNFEPSSIESKPITITPPHRISPITNDETISSLTEEFEDELAEVNLLSDTTEEEEFKSLTPEALNRAIQSKNGSQQIINSLKTESEEEEEQEEVKDEFTTLAEEASDHFQQGQYKKAVETYSTAINLIYSTFGSHIPSLFKTPPKNGDLNPLGLTGLFDVHVERGCAYLQLNLLDSAISDFTTSQSILNEHNSRASITRNVNDDVPLFNRGIAYRKKGLFELAIKDFSDAVEMYQDKDHSKLGSGLPSELLYQRSLTYLANNNLQLALADTQLAFEIEQSIARLSPGFRQFMASQSELIKSENQRRISLHEANNTPVPQGALLQEIQVPDYLFDRIRWPILTKILNLKARLLNSLDRSSEAVEGLEMILSKFDQKNVEARFHLGVAHYHISDADNLQDSERSELLSKAVDSFSRAIQENAGEGALDHGMLYEFRARVWKEMGEKEKASKDFMEALKRRGGKDERLEKEMRELD